VCVCTHNTRAHSKHFVLVDTDMHTYIHTQHAGAYILISSSVAREPILPDAAPGSARAAASCCIASCRPIGGGGGSRVSHCISHAIAIALAILMRDYPPHKQHERRTGSSSMVAAWMEQRGAKLPVKKEVSTSKPRIRPGKASLMMLQSCPACGKEYGWRERLCVTMMLGVATPCQGPPTTSTTTIQAPMT
jgi:hypothetical protein